MRYWIGFTAVFCLLTSWAEADTFEFNLNDYSAQLGYRMRLSEDDFGRSVLGGRVLFNDHKESLLGSAGLDFTGFPGNVPGLELGVGVQLYGGQADDDREVLGLGVGGRLDYRPPILGGASIGTKIFYVPGILAFLDADRLLETGVRLGYALTPRIALHLEYQFIEADLEDRGDRKIDNGVRLGFEARF